LKEEEEELFAEGRKIFDEGRKPDNVFAEKAETLKRSFT